MSFAPFYDTLIQLEIEMIRIPTIMSTAIQRVELRHFIFNQRKIKTLKFKMILFCPTGFSKTISPSYNYQCCAIRAGNHYFLSTRLQMT